MSRNVLLKIFCFFSFARCAISAAAPKPHIVLVLADDYGWANLGYHHRETTGSESDQARAETHTPNLDGLIDHGILLNRHYVYKICSPSRSSLQSGRLAVHVNDLNTGVTVTNPDDPVSGFAGVPRNMTGMAEKLRSAGYKTHMVGKWDAGMATPEQTPWGRGYDTWVGYYQHANDYWRKSMPLQAVGELDNCWNRFTDLSQHNESYRGGVTDGVSTSEKCLADPSAELACYEEELFKERALATVRDHDPSTPLFLFYAFHLLHTPLQVPEKYLDQIDQIVASKGASPIDTQNRRLLAAMVLYMDEAVGELVQALKAKRMWDNTLLVFSADNGGAVYLPGSGNNYPLRGGKYADFEGGVRVNAFVAGGFVPSEKQGSSFEGVVSIADWYGTFCELAGADAVDYKARQANEWLRGQNLPLLPEVDSIAQWDFIVSGKNGRPDPLQLSSQAVLWFPFKLVTGKQPYGTWQGAVYPNCSTLEQEAQGPYYADLKIYDHKISVGKTVEEEDRLTWTADCQEGCLFNIEDDPTEHHNLANDPKHAAILAKLHGELQKMNKTHFNPYRGVTQLAACDQFVDNGGFYGPFVNADGYYSALPTPSLSTKVKNKVKKLGLRVLNTGAFGNGLVAIAKKVLPIGRDLLQSRFDKCYNHSSPDSHFSFAELVV